MPFPATQLPMDKIRSGDMVIIPVSTVATVAETALDDNGDITVILTTGRSYTAPVGDQLTVIERANAGSLAQQGS